MGYARNVPIILSAHAVIAINGSYGTLSEISYTLTYEKPIIGLKTWDAQPYYSENTPFIIRAETAEEAVRIAIKEAKNYIKKTKNPV
jgi:predicted Rossmann-fold nucleotide-binding protein